MAWMWGMSGPDGSEAPATEPSEDDLARARGLGAPARGFVSQADAESWLGLVWRDLADQGVQAVSLYEEQRLVYGPMSLSAD
jgi:hypothetical protein